MSDLLRKVEEESTAPTTEVVYEEGLRRIVRRWRRREQIVSTIRQRIEQLFGSSA